MKYNVFLLSMLLFHGCAASVDQDGAVEKLSVGPNWTEEGKLLHYELDFLGEVNGFGLYQEFHQAMAASVPHGRTRLLLVNEENVIGGTYFLDQPLAKELVDEVLYFDCEGDNTMDFSAGPPERVAVCGQLVDLFWQ